MSQSKTFMLSCVAKKSSESELQGHLKSPIIIINLALKMFQEGHCNQFCKMTIFGWLILSDYPWNETAVAAHTLSLEKRVQPLSGDGFTTCSYTIIQTNNYINTTWSMCCRVPSQICHFRLKHCFPLTNAKHSYTQYLCLMLPCFQPCCAVPKMLLNCHHEMVSSKPSFHWPFKLLRI